MNSGVIAYQRYSIGGELRSSRPKRGEALFRIERMGYRVEEGRGKERYRVIDRDGQIVLRAKALYELVAWADRVDWESSDAIPEMISDTLPKTAFEYEATQLPDGRWHLRNIKTKCPLSARCNCGSDRYWMECRLTDRCDGHLLDRSR